jgi:hypothetical protein
MQDTQGLREQWRRWSTPPERQRDRRWLQRYRDLVTSDADWWWTAAGPFTEEEQGRWERYRSASTDEVTRASLTALMTRSRQRELQAAWVEQRAPRFRYPALPLDDVRARRVELSQLRTTIFQEEPDELVSYLYAGAIDEAMQELRLLEATGEGNTAAFREGNHRLFRAPSPEEMIAAFFRLRRLIQQGLERSDTAALSLWLHHFVEHRLCLILDLSEGKDDPPVVSEQKQSEQAVSAQTVKAFVEASLRTSGYEGWQVGLDRRGDGFHVHAETRRVLLPATRHTLTEVRRLLAHELAGRVARTFAGEHAPIGLLGIGTQGHAATEAGIGWSYEREALSRHGLPCSDVALWCGTLATGLASGVGGLPQPFWSLHVFFEHLLLLDRRLSKPWEERLTAQRQARRQALARCLRTYRGVPDLTQGKVCLLQDVAPLRGWQRIERAVAVDTTALDRLMGGNIAYALLPALQAVLPVPPPQPLRELAYATDLDEYICSFETSPEEEGRYNRKNDLETD